MGVDEGPDPIVIPVDVYEYAGRLQGVLTSHTNVEAGSASSGLALMDCGGVLLDKSTVLCLFTMMSRN